MTAGAILIALFLKPALVVSAAAGASAVLRRRSAAARHLVWTAAVVTLLALPALQLVLPPLRVFIPGVGGASFGADETSLETIAAVGAGGTAVSPSREPAGRTDAQRALRAPLVRADRVAAALVGVWLLGVLVLAIRRALLEVRMRRLVRRSPRISSSRLWQLSAASARRGGLRHPAELRLGDGATMPAVMGVLRPVLLLPSAVDRWPDTDITAVLVHEYAHIARRDCLVNAIADVALVLHWCNPLVHLAVRRLRAESERACDDRVLMAGVGAERYADLLLHVARTQRPLPAAATAMARPSELEARIVAVLDPRTTRTPMQRWIAAAVAALTCVVALPAATVTLVAAPLQVALPAGPEPDLSGDSLSHPRSERLPLDRAAYRVSPAARHALGGPDSALVRILITALDRVPEHDADLVRERAAWALSRIRDGRLVEPLLTALDHPDWRVQSYAAWTLAAAHDARAVTRLTPLLDHPVWRLRAMAASALRAIGDPAAAPDMRPALSDPAWQVRVEAVEFFAAIGAPDLSRTLQPLLSDRHIAVRGAARRALTTR